MEKLRAFFHWFGSPFRALARGLMVLVCLTPRQIQSLCTIFLIGGIIVFSWQQWFYVMLARSMARTVPDESKAWDVLISSSDHLFWLLLGCMVAICLIAWGATHFAAKIREIEVRAGREPDEPTEESDS